MTYIFGHTSCYLESLFESWIGSPFLRWDSLQGSTPQSYVPIWLGPRNPKLPGNKIGLTAWSTGGQIRPVLTIGNV